jgi:hypothetical protein
MNGDLPFESIRDELDTVPIALANKIEREWPAKWQGVTDSWLVLSGMVRIASNTHKSIRYLCADSPPDPTRKLEYAVSVPPLARTILDSLFTVVFLLEDLPARMPWYLKSGWRELLEEHQRYQAAYGSDPAWSSWLTGTGNFVASMQARAGVTPQEASAPSSIPWWPNPGQMLRSGKLSPQNLGYLQYLNDWFYRSLSSASHLSLPGFMIRSGYLFDARHSDKREEFLTKYKSDSVVTATILLVALISELELSVGFGLGPRCAYLWGALAPSFGAAQEVYSLRYQGRLPQGS